MGRSVALQCDICRKPTTKIVGKLFYSPVTPSMSKKSAHNNYEIHLDVGTCCAEKLRKGFAWTKRKSAAEYNADRRKA